MWHERPGTRLIEPGDTGFWHSLWRTPRVRELLTNPASDYAWVLPAAARRPWWFVPPTTAYERRHFSAWFGQTFIVRDYPNPVITDLFHLHDLLHALTLLPRVFKDQAHWRQVMRANEIAVSLETEILVYWRAPGLRETAFDFPIWHDELDMPLRSDLRNRLVRQRLLRQGAEGGAEQALRDAVGAWPLPLPAAMTPERLDWDSLWDLRRAITHWPTPGRPTEEAMARYESQAEPFYDTWAGAWEAVEAERLAFDQRCARGDWRAAVQARQQHWEQCSDENGVPYGQMAQSLVSQGFG